MSSTPSTTKALFEVLSASIEEFSNNPVKPKIKAKKKLHPITESFLSNIVTSIFKKKSNSNQSPQKDDDGETIDYSKLNALFSSNGELKKEFDLKEKVEIPAKYSAYFLSSSGKEPTTTKEALLNAKGNAKILTEKIKKAISIYKPLNDQYKIIEKQIDSLDPQNTSAEEIASILVKHKNNPKLAASFTKDIREKMLQLTEGFLSKNAALEIPVDRESVNNAIKLNKSELGDSLYKLMSDFERELVYGFDYSDLPFRAHSDELWELDEISGILNSLYIDNVWDPTEVFDDLSNMVGRFSEALVYLAVKSVKMD